MNKAVNWEKVREQWPQSSHATPLQESEILAIIEVLKFVVNNEKKLPPFESAGIAGTSSINRNNDGFPTPYDLVTLVITQGSVHKIFYATHLNMKGLKTIETCVVVPNSNVIRYFKIQMKCKGDSWKNPSNIKDFAYCYHPSKHGTEVIYHEN